jgi:hypothetical protein
MAQTREGAIKVCASRAKVTVDEYLEKVQAGMKWCYACEEWHAVSLFGRDTSRFDGLTALCVEQRNKRQRDRYDPVPIDQRKPMGPPHLPPRDGDKKQARQRINVLVRTGRKPHPNKIPCTDCGHEWKRGERRHVYDHYLGYASAHHYDVESVCTTCDAKRSRKRGEMRDLKVRTKGGRFGALKDRAKEGRVSHG